jgi:hypothetical protein
LLLPPPLPRMTLLPLPLQDPSTIVSRPWAMSSPVTPSQFLFLLFQSLHTLSLFTLHLLRSRVEVSHLRDSVEQIKTVLTSKKTGQTDMKKLWLQKAELEESLRMLNSLELLKVTSLSLSLHLSLIPLLLISESTGRSITSPASDKSKPLSCCSQHS